MAAVMLRYQRKYPRPMPPLVDVDMGNGHKVKEFNYADPDYDGKVRKWEKFMAEQASFETLKRIQASLTLNQEQQAAVEE